MPAIYGQCMVQKMNYVTVKLKKQVCVLPMSFTFTVFYNIIMSLI